MMIGWPSWREAMSQSARIWMSVVPPAGQGTIMRIGRLGKRACPSAGLASAAAPSAMAARRLSRAGVLVMRVPSLEAAAFRPLVYS